MNKIELQKILENRDKLIEEQKFQVVDLKNHWFIEEGHIREFNPECEKCRGIKFKIDYNETYIQRANFDLSFFGNSG